MNKSRDKSSLRNKLAYSIANSLIKTLHLFPPETAHNIGLKLLQARTHKLMLKPSPQILNLDLRTSLPSLGLLPHPIGLAAGFDKSATCPLSWYELGFSFVEFGTVTPKAQKGNEKPRLFREKSQLALINRMGFNNDGCHQVRQRLEKAKLSKKNKVFGINIGKNSITPNEYAIQDYLQVLSKCDSLENNYYVMNISSPNTKGLRSLANKDFLRKLAEEIKSLRIKGVKDIWIKLSPDIARKKFQELISVITEEAYAGIILSNTHSVQSPTRGGLSGHPLSMLSSQALEWAFAVHQGSLAMIGSGGILSGIDILEKIRRGAYAVQIYTALVYRGPWVVSLLLEELANEMKLLNIQNLNELRGSYYPHVS